ncbi:MAG: uroporphyrinogen-III synthase [Deltaproteobacteria bacterium]|nr:uroporphyrinogen-III synthase [Deltaproteobacteria bacterium]
MTKKQTIILTRIYEDNLALEQMLIKKGFVVKIIPLIKITPIDNIQIENAAKSINEYDFIVFTSSKGAKHFLPRLDNSLKIPKIICTYSKTAAAVASCGFNPDFTGDGTGSFNLAGDIDNIYGLNGKKILYPSSDIAKSSFKNRAVELGAAKVEMLPVYQNIPVEGFSTKLSNFHQNGMDDFIFVFYSESVVDNFVNSVDQYSNINAVSIGKSTTSALLKNGILNCKEAEFPDNKHIVKAIELFNTGGAV